MIIRAKHNFVIYNFFKLYTLFQLKRCFRNVYLNGNFTDRGLPVVIISNHSGWWDGFWVMYLNIKIFRRKFHFMMLEEQLLRNWFFMFTGGFSVKKGTRSIIETLHHAGEIIEKRENLLLVFPQGKIESVFKPVINFEKGIERLLQGKEGKIHLVFNVNLTEYFSYKKPSLYIYFTEPEPVSYSLNDLEESYNSFFRSCREANIKEGALL